MSKLVSITDLSKEIGLSVTSIRRGVASKRFPATRANTENGKLLFDLELIQQILRQEVYSNLRNCDMDAAIEEPEPKRTTSYLAGLFPTSSDPVIAQAEQDIRFGYTPMHTNTNGSFAL